MNAMQILQGPFDRPAAHLKTTDSQENLYGALTTIARFRLPEASRRLAAQL
jgi:hypothetical protein